jgi:hypothetical protein
LSIQMTALGPTDQEVVVGVDGKEDYPYSRLIHLARRVDWRFLLPDPRLGRVAYLGLYDRLHIDALRLFSDFFSIADGKRSIEASNDKFDTVVVTEPNCVGLSQATDLLKSGGYLYLESPGFFRRILRRPADVIRSSIRDGLVFPEDYASILENSGFIEAKIHWHWPSFENCIKIIPLEEEEPTQYLYLYSRGSFKARIRAFLGRMLSWSGLMKRVVPHFSILARRA